MAESRQGALIVFEAIDGAGLTTHSKALVESLKKRDLRAFRDKEPTYEVIGDLIWHAIRGFYPSLNTPPILALLYAADRLHHLYQKIPGNPYGTGGILYHAANGAIAVLDRYKYSSYAYQSADPRMPLPYNWIREVNAYAPPPHVLIYLRVPLDVALKRLAESRYEVQLYEKREELKRVQEAFEKIIEGLKRRPEYCPGSDAPWKELLRSEGLDPEALYPSGQCYPVVIEVNEVADGRELGKEELADYIEAAVLIALERLGIYTMVDRGIREKYDIGVRSGVISTTIK